MAVCGLNISMNSFQGEVTAQISGFLNLESSLTAPSGAAAYLSNLEGGLATLKAKTDTLIPDIPLSTSGLTSLRDELGSLSSMSLGSAGALSKMASIAQEYAGLTSLSGFADIDLTDLSKSVFGFSGTFDPCSLTNKIPNVMRDNVTGALQKLPTIQPDIGQTFAAAKIALPDQEVIDNVATAVADNLDIINTLDVADVEMALETNIVPAISGLGDGIKRSNINERIVETKADVIEELKTHEKILDDIVPEIEEKSEEVVKKIKEGSMLDTTTRYFYADPQRQRKMMKSKMARKAALKEFKASSGLTKGALIKGFNAKVKAGEVDYYGRDVTSSGWDSMSL